MYLHTYMHIYRHVCVCVRECRVGVILQDSALPKCFMRLKTSVTTIHGPCCRSRVGPEASTGHAPITLTLSGRRGCMGNNR